MSCGSDRVLEIVAHVSRCRGHDGVQVLKKDVTYDANIRITRQMCYHLLCDAGLNRCEIGKVFCFRAGWGVQSSIINFRRMARHNRALWAELEGYAAELGIELTGLDGDIVPKLKVITKSRKVAK